MFTASKNPTTQNLREAETFWKSVHSYKEEKDFRSREGLGEKEDVVNVRLLITTWPELASKSKEEFGEWLADRGLLWKERLCPNSGIPVKVAQHANVNSIHEGYPNGPP
ncbi:hypothetical protein RB195_017796 [Necator americanus]|uniref:Uncharacterized protein n=1 Tax=Necator americanus TaxID=51031 RepID=A0ABR1C6U1_NECAM